MDEVRRIFKPEFLNRIDETIVFHALTKEHMGQIVDIMMKGLCDRTKAQMDITLVMDDAAKAFIIEKGYDQKYGARPLRRYLQSNVENLIARTILSGDLSAGSTLTIDVANNDLICRY